MTKFMKRVYIAIATTLSVLLLATATVPAQAQPTATGTMESECTFALKATTALVLIVSGTDEEQAQSSVLQLATALQQRNEILWNSLYSKIFVAVIEQREVIRTNPYAAVNELHPQVWGACIQVMRGIV